MADPKVGERYGDWELLALEGQGGNGWVWRARHHRTGEEAASKILKTRRTDADAYQRFRREVATLVDLGQRPGVLPLRDHCVPEHLAQGERAWFVMPLAQRIDAALAASDLPQVVAAFASFAHALAELYEEVRLTHRDLKPQNLYRWGQQFVVGDFGLVHMPDAESLTAPGKVVAPANYVPWELLEDPDGADPAPADVYMLSKALWVIATSQRWPPPGPQRAGGPLSVTNYRPHPRGRLLDQIIERGTWPQPSDRLSMGELYRELQTWLDMPDEPQQDLDLAHLAAELRLLTERELNVQAREERWRAATLEAYRFVEDRLGALATALEDSLPQVRVDPVDSSVQKQIGFYPAAGPQPLEDYAIGVWSVEATSVVPLQLHLGASLTLLDTGDLLVRGLMTLGNEGESLQDLWYSDELQAPVGGAQSQAHLETLVEELQQRLSNFARAFAQQLA